MPKSKIYEQFLISFCRETRIQQPICFASFSGKCPWDRAFVFRILTYVFLPISALLGAQFPDVLRQAVSWLSSSEILK